MLLSGNSYGKVPETTGPPSSGNQNICMATSISNVFNPIHTDDKNLLHTENKFGTAHCHSQHSDHSQLLELVELQHQQCTSRYWIYNMALLKAVSRHSI
jgi:hypothetical protein